MNRREKLLWNGRLAHDLIVVIANQGSTDLVMDAAREAGATGGTVIHAKGTGTDLVRKFFRRVHRVGSRRWSSPWPGARRRSPL